MFIIEETDRYRAWFANLRDLRARARILDRLARAGEGNLGDVRAVGGGVMEMRIPIGPGYRVYCIRRGQSVIVLLAGGDKSSQARDIKKAIRLATRLREGDR